MIQDDDNAHFIPSPEYIAERCREFQSQWSDEERFLRQRGVARMHHSDFAKVRREAEAKLQARLVPMDRVEVVEETAERGDAVSWELESLVLA